MRRVSPLVCVLVLVASAACAGPGPVPSLTRRSTVPAWSEPQAPDAIFDEFGQAQIWVSALRRGHDDAVAIVRSAAFRAWLDDVEVLHAWPGQGAMSGARVASLLLRANVAGAPEQRYPVCYRYQVGGTTETAVSGFEQSTGACGKPGGAMVSVITLRTATRNRLASADLETRACGINTLVHEWTHAIGRDGERSLASVFGDRGHDDHATPLVSYTAGSLAQCLYLAEARRKAGDGELDVDACVEAVGTTTFRPLTCKPGWSKQLANVAVAGACP